LFAKSEETNCVSLACYTTRAIQITVSLDKNINIDLLFVSNQIYRKKIILYGFASYFGHNGSFTAQILITQAQKAINNKGFKAISYTIKIDIIVIVIEEQ
jgi:hypothetical protein